MQYDAYDVSLKMCFTCTLKDVLGHYKLWNEVMLWFAQMMCLQCQVCPEMQGNEIYALYDKHQKESYPLFSIIEL